MMTGKLNNNLIIFLLIAATVTGGLVFYFAKNSQPSPEELKAEASGIIDYQKKELTPDATAMGNPNAPITVYEFSDFECSFCARFASETFPQIKEEYIDTGKVKWVYKFFPLPFHKQAKDAAEAGLCAGAQGKFWEYHDKLYFNQPDFSAKQLKMYAKELELNEAEYNYCLDKDFYKNEVENDLREGEAGNVRGTPTFFVNGEMLIGAQSFDVFSRIIESQLK